VAMLMQAFLRFFNRMGRDGHDQAAVLHAFKAYESVSELGDSGGLAVHDEDFQAGVVVEVGVAGGDDELVAGVLQLGKGSRMNNQHRRCAIEVKESNSNRRGSCLVSG